MFGFYKNPALWKRNRAMKSPAVIEQHESETEQLRQLSPMFRVVMHDDPVTTMDFVVNILIKIFRHDAERAVETMYQIHRTGSEWVGIMPLEHAEHKVEMVHFAARAQGFPLTCTIEEENVL